ncbi:hypothetical protein B4O97_17610 [Marispirochaeta aestuarii]|uniref:histidine kinase n=1 Tax=Marispirochaeta aestuarii TaxID=1963862 RepID=A0A1Y1RTI4_9SPIO|nr:sensor histidine kinase [Marispirochaeta aestuarii]ORC30721.1 hypothetical protein B4O97_17610 [Marispirochaeta aestuarii]
MKLGSIWNDLARNVFSSYADIDEIDKRRIEACLSLALVFFLTTIIYMSFSLARADFMVLPVTSLWAGISLGSFLLILKGKYDAGVLLEVTVLGILLQCRMILFPGINEHLPYDADLFLTILVFFAFLSGLTVRWIVLLHSYALVSLINVITFSFLYYQKDLLVSLALSTTFFHIFPMGIAYLLHFNIKRLQRLSQLDKLLLKESNHRIKNNLIILSSIINLEKKHDNSPQNHILDDLRAKVDAIMYLHEALYTEGAYRFVELSYYFDNLFQNTMRIEPEVTINSTVEGLRLDTKPALEIGLVLVELINNSLKHAVPRDSNIVINIDVFLKNRDLYIVYRDNGEALHTIHSIEDLSARTGLLIITRVVSGLGGTIQVDSNYGLKFTIVLPIEHNLYYGDLNPY